MILEHLPNIVKGQPITCDLMNRWRRSLEELARFGWETGLLPSNDGERSLELSMEPQDVFRLRRLRAVGERGWPLVVDDGRPDLRVAPFDASRLPAGRYDLYVCLTGELVPHGEEVEFRSPDDGALRRYRRDVFPRLVIVSGRDRLQHRDWMQIGVILRTVADGIVRTQLDHSFHPPIRTMAAYLRTNPLPRLVDDFVRRIDEAPEHPFAPLLRAELKTLAALAEHGESQIVFMQTHRCLSLAREFLADCPPLRANLDTVRYSRETFCRFLELLAEPPSEPWQFCPDVLSIEGVRYLRADGEFTADGDFWIWRPTHEGFVARAVALYLPHALANVPYVHYGHHREEAARWPLAHPVADLSYAGAAVTMTDIRMPIEALYLRTSKISENQNLLLKLGEGHAVYYQ